MEKIWPFPFVCIPNEEEDYNFKVICQDGEFIERSIINEDVS